MPRCDSRARAFTLCRLACDPVDRCERRVISTTNANIVKVPSTNKTNQTIAIFVHRLKVRLRGLRLCMRINTDPPVLRAFRFAELHVVPRANPSIYGMNKLRLTSRSSTSGCVSQRYAPADSSDSLSSSSWQRRGAFSRELTVNSSCSSGMLVIKCTSQKP
jgi:hypothetical protein